MWFLLTLAFFAVSAISTLATGAPLDPAVLVAAAAPDAVPALGALAVDASLESLRLLSRLRMERTLRVSRHAAHHPPPHPSGARPPPQPRAPMRRFAEHVAWDDLKARFTPAEFRVAHGLSLDAFDAVLTRIRPIITDKERGHGGQRNGHRVPAEIKLHLTLRWLRGGQYHDFLAPYGISKTNFYGIVWRVCRAICATHSLPMAAAVAAARQGDDSCFRRWAAGFATFTLGTIATCFGAIDGVQISILKPSAREVSNPACYFNRYSKATVNMQAVADATGRVLYIAASAPGGMHDNQALNTSRLADILTSLLVPLGYLLVGDEAYVNGPGMLCPFSGPEHGSKEDHYNYYQSLTRNPVERAFGMIERRWGILWRRLECRLAHVPLVLLTICLLHNICMDHAVPIADLPEVTDAQRLPRTGDGQTYQGRRFDTEQTELREAIATELARRGMQRPAVGAPRRAAHGGRGRGGRGRGRGAA